MLGLEKWEEMGRTQTVKSTDLWLAKVQVDMAWAFCWRSEVLWFRRNPRVQRATQDSDSSYGLPALADDRV